MLVEDVEDVVADVLQLLLDLGEKEPNGLGNVSTQQEHDYSLFFVWVYGRD